MTDTTHCFLCISIAGQASRSVVIQLFAETCPKTCENFIALLCSSSSSSKSKPQPSYRGTEFHRIVNNFMVQGGDFDKFDGTGGYSPLTGSTFKDESFSIPHDQPGRVSMANRGPNTNGSQFFITLAATSHLDGKHVCFGQVVKGMDVVHAMTTVECECDGSRPVAMQRIVVVDCGVGKGGREENSSSDDDDDDERERKKKAKKRKKKKKKHRNDDDDSYERRRKKKHKKQRKRDDNSSSDSDQSDEKHRRTKKRSKRDSDGADLSRKRRKKHTSSDRR
jgi:peptidyl-prolyl isomerase G (cyclophilin G)